MQLFLIIAGLIFLNLNGQTISDYNFDFPEISISRSEGYDKIFVEGCTYNTNEGYPSLPVIKKVIDLGSMNTIDSFKVTNVSIDILEGEFSIFPVQEAKKTNSLDFAYPVKKSEIYTKDTLLNEERVKVDFTSKNSDSNFAVLSLSPTMYNPAKKTLYYIKSFSVRIFSSSKETGEDFSKNSFEIDESVFDHSVEYAVIIDTSNISGRNHPELLEVFEDFIFWKNKIGITTKLFTLDFIENAFFSGTKDENIKGFIKFMHDNYSTRYVLLVGEDDEDIDDLSFSYAESDVGEWMPRHDVFFFDASTGVTDDDTIVSDYWFGDINDDLMPEVSVGRVLFDEYDNAFTACSLFVVRTIRYEQNPPSGYLNKMLLTSEQIFENYFGKSISESLSVNNPANMEDVKYYDEDGTYDDEITLNTINQGVGIYHTASHGSTYCHMLASGDPITNSDIDAYLNVNDKSYIFFGYPCFLGSVDYDSYIEHLMSDPSTGAVASLANSRYGFVNMSYPGRSDYQSLYFLKAFSQEGFYRIGDAKKSMNEKSAVFAYSDPYAKYCLFEYNLYGDPTLLMWTDEPKDLYVLHPDTISSDSPLSFLVYESDKTTPVSDALVTLWGKNDRDFYAREKTDMSGGVIIPISPSLSQDTVYITVVKHNRRVYEGEMILHLLTPSIPKILRPLQFSKTTDATPMLSFISSDSENRNLIYRIILSKNHDFSNSDTLFTSSCVSGYNVFFTLPYSLEFGATYFFTVSAENTDKLRSNESAVSSFTVSDDILPGTLSWFKTDSLQFNSDSLIGAFVDSSGVSLGYLNTMLYEVIFEEDFEYNSMPSNWLIVDGNGDGYKFKSGASNQKALKGYDPPDMGSYYCYYADSDVRQTYTKANEFLYTASYYCAQSETLKFYCGYGFYSIRAAETFTLEIVKFVNGSWTSPEIIYYFTKNFSDALTFNLTSHLPAESIKVYFHYTNTDRRGGAVAVNNIKLISKRYPEIMSGTYKSQCVSFNDFYSIYPKMNWGRVKVQKNLPSDSIVMHLEYQNSGIWKDIPEAVLNGNSFGFITGETFFDIDISSLNPFVYDTVRVVAGIFRTETKSISSPSIKSVELGIDISVSTSTCMLSLEGEKSADGIMLNLSANSGFNELLFIREENGKSKVLKKFFDSPAGLYCYEDKSAAEKKTYSYYACAVNNSDTVRSNTISASFKEKTRIITLSNSVAKDFIILKANYSSQKEEAVKIFDIAGNTVKECFVKMENGESKLDVKSLNSGVYFLSFPTNGKATHKVTLLR